MVDKTPKRRDCKVEAKLCVEDMRRYKQSNGQPAGDVPVHILLLGKVLEALGNVVGHRGQPLVGDLVQLLTVSLVHKMSPRQKIPFSEYK